MTSSENRFVIWFRAIRVPFFTATVVPVALGAVLAWYDTSALLWARFCLTLSGAILIHAGTISIMSLVPTRRTLHLRLSVAAAA
jgi:1,4-dihydroxy-2-naphthoate octaprenyltransferase